jgi:hypothetical protein
MPDDVLDQEDNMSLDELAAQEEHGAQYEETED